MVLPQKGIELPLRTSRLLEYQLLQSLITKAKALLLDGVHIVDPDHRERQAVFLIGQVLLRVVLHATHQDFSFLLRI